MSEIKKITFVYYIIGDGKTGKNSIVSRFRILNSSNTIIEDNNSFKKIYTISNQTFELSFHKISSAENIQFNDNLNEDDENLKNHKLNFSNLIKQIKTLRSSIEQTENLKEIFLFCFDLSKHSTLDKLKIYYEELNGIFQFDDAFKAVIGNKVDKKKNLGEEQIETLDFFRYKKTEDNLVLDSSNINKILLDKMPYYEISTKNFFNFERFYEKLFFDLFEKTEPGYQTNYFKERFRNIMIFKPTFSKSERTYFQSNNVPGPQKYERANVYDLGNEKVFNSEQERTKLISEFFRGKKRYTTKIFVNKKGPVFSNKKGADFQKKHQVDKLQDTEMNKTITTIPFPQEYYQKLYNNFSGYTFGIKTHKKIGLRERRKEEYETLKHSFDDIFTGFNNITTQKFFGKTSNEKRAKTTDKISSKLAKKKRKHKVINVKELEKKREEEIKQKIKNKVYVKPLRDISERRTHFDDTKRKRFGPDPGPGNYEIPGSISLNKGYTFGTKSNTTETLVKTAPAYVLLPSDFDNIEEHATFCQAERFPKIKHQYEAIPKADEESIYHLKLVDKITNKIEERINRVDRMRKENLRQIVEKEKNVIKTADFQTPGPGAYDIKYQYAEEKLPFYSLGGRLDKIQHAQQNPYEDPNKLYNLEQSFSMLSKNVANSMYPLPNYNTVKPNVPGMLFGSSERFPQAKPSERPGHTLYNKFDTVEINNDKDKVLYLGKSKRFQDFQRTFFQGPELYRITGFAENLVKKNEKINELREKRKLKSLNTNQKNSTMNNFSRALKNMISENIDDIPESQ